MEIKKVPRQANQFWPSFFKQSLTLVIIAQILIISLLGGALIMLEVFTFDSLLLWEILGGLFIVSLAISIFTFVAITKPTKDLMSAIVHIAGDRSNLTPPNPNSKKYEKTGFKQALQTIYELSGARAEKSLTTPADDEHTAPASSAISDALDISICGFITLGHDRVVSYSNKAAPIRIDSSGVKSLNLLFNGTDTLDAWLDACDENAVHAEKIWTRIPDRLPGEEGRRLFDVIASYQKGAKTETVLTLIDRTSLYLIDEENLDFISFAAHELRGPITVIRGYLDVLEDELKDVLQDDQHELFRRLVVSANRLSGYINNILNTSRYDRRHLKVHLIEDSVANVYDTIKDDMQLRASSQNRLLSVQLPADLPTIAVDRASLSEVFANLIDNAVKYSNEGGTINVNAAVKGDYVEVSIQDFGIGMPGSVVSNLFQKFYRSHRSRETVAGTGIGLYISKAIVESHGGTIAVRSEEGKGSTFIVSLPIYATVAHKLQAGNNSNEGLIDQGKGWIKNHSMFRG
ncbi:MAG TPA: HAMP domain-containing sensor histidine kinase [Candidatus Saccharimonadales bacterium]|nr:HAMP domain-containing sensor histidine kinase [Candidatus Saccharimonadales bacterium]